MDIFKSWLATMPIAHRGFHNDSAPENSLAAFKNAISHNFAIELDVRIIDDGTIVVFHDDKLSRMTSADSYICKSKYEDIKNLRLLKTEETIPTFGEVLACVNGQVPLLIELKNDNNVGALEKGVLELLKNYNGEFAVQSFNPYSLEYFRNAAPHILRGQLSCFFRGLKMSSFKKYILKRMLLNKRISQPDFISYKHDELPNRYVRKYSDLPILAWTIQSNSTYESTKNYCNNIIFEGFVPKK